MACGGGELRRGAMAPWHDGTMASGGNPRTDQDATMPPAGDYAVTRWHDGTVASGVTPIRTTMPPCHPTTMPPYRQTLKHRHLDEAGIQDLGVPFPARTSIYLYTDTPIYHYTDSPIYQYTDIPIYHYTDIPIYRYTDIPIY